MNEIALREQLRKDILAHITPCKADHRGEAVRGCVCRFNDGLRTAANAVGGNPSQRRGWVTPDFVLVGAPSPSGNGKMLIASQEMGEAEMIRETIGIDRVPIGRMQARLPVIRTTLVAELMQFGTVYADSYQQALQTFMSETVIPATKAASLALPAAE